MALDSKYLIDDTTKKSFYDDNKGNISTDTLLKGAAILAGGILGYKSGLFKEAIRDSAKLSAEHKPTVSIIFNDLRKWMNGNDETVQNSIFRKGILKTIYEANEEAQKSTKDLITRIQSIAEDTKEDWEKYKRRVNKTLERVTQDQDRYYIENNYNNTKLLRDIKYKKEAINGTYSGKYSTALQALETKINDNIITNAISSNEEQLKSLKLKGYKKATLDDLFDIKINEKTNKVELVGKTKFNFSEMQEEDNKSAISQIEDLLNSNVVTEKGNIAYINDKKVKMFQKHKDFRNMVLDNDLLIDDKGEFIDLRNRRKSNKEFIRNLATEWKIPIVGFNPFKLVGLDKIGREKINYASISEDYVMPFLTGIRGNAKENTIKNLKDKNELLKNVREGVTIIDGDVYRISDDGKGITKINYKSKKEIIKVPKSRAYSTSSLTQTENSLRRISGIQTKQFTDKEYNEMTFKEKLFKILDIGYQERDVVSLKDKLFKDTRDEQFYDFGRTLDFSNPDAYAENMISKLFKNKHKEVTTFDNFTQMMKPGTNAEAEDTYMIINRDMKLKDLKFNKMNSEEILNFIKDYSRQFVVDFNKDFEAVNRKTGGVFFLTDRLSQTIGSVGLGLGDSASSGPIKNITSLIAKRFLPVYGAYQAFNFIGGIGAENTKTDEEGHTLPSSLHQHLLSAMVKTDVGVHNFTNRLGITNFFKRLGEVLPGSDQIEELPGIKALNLQDTGEERADYWENGMDPIRKGRYWFLSNDAFTGGKIMYYRPNAYKRALGDAEYSNAKYGSRFERLMSVFIPHYYDSKHYYDRPYLMTSSAFENVPVFGPALSGTIGQVIGRPKKMHEEYWNGNRPKTFEEVKQMRQTNSQLAMQQNENIPDNINLNALTIMQYTDKNQKTNYFNQQVNEKNNKMLAEVYRMYGQQGTATQLQKAVQHNGIKDTIITKVKDFFGKILKGADYGSERYLPPYGSAFAQNTVGPSDDYKMQLPNLENPTVYKTGSGNLSIVDLGNKDAYGSYKINKENATINQIKGANDKYDINDSYVVSESDVEEARNSNIENPYALGNVLQDQYINTANVAGIYGFGLTGFVTGNPGAGRTEIETSSYNYSFNKQFWDAEMGGLTGDISEIFRRLVQKRRNDVNYYNPIRNTMPNWLPGEGAFIDMQHGDPYSKIPRGEERLPGEAFEKMNNVDLSMQLGASTIGKTKEQIIQHLLNMDEITDDDSKDIVGEGKAMHKKLETAIINSGLGINSEVKMEDKKNNIIGCYDVKIHDPSSRSGEAIVDIKTINQKEFNAVKMSHKAKEEHQRQVNWYLHQDNKKSNGIILYVNRDNKDKLETFQVNFKYSEKMYKDTMKNVKEARQEIKDKINNHEMSRAELYSPLQKLQILANVAPYSQEYNEMKNQVANMDLDEEQTKKYRQIREMVSEQRKQTRVYPYRFLSAKTEEHTVKMGRQIDATKFMTNGFDSPIKLAGLKILKTTEDGKPNENYDKAMEFLKKNMGQGKKVKIEVDADDLKLKNNDTLQTINATVYANGKNINRELIKKGLATENKEDYSAPGVHARFSPLERMIGRQWEKMAHWNTFVNNRILRVRSAAEDYERSQVYGKEFRNWQNPIKDYLTPAINTAINSPVGIISGATIGSFFGKTPFGKLMGGIAGASIVSLGKAHKHVYEATNKKTWIPKEVRRQRELEDYMDKLKYVKNRRLFEIYAKKALIEDKQDVKKIIKIDKLSGNKKKGTANRLKQIKRKDKQNDTVSLKQYEKNDVDFDFTTKLPSIVRAVFTKQGREQLKQTFSDITSNDKLSTKIENVKEDLKAITASRTRAIMKEVNAKINEPNTDRKNFKLSKNSMKAIAYYNAAKNTMYGYEPGDSVNAFISALPSKDKKYFNDLLEAPEMERKKILKIAPKYMRRALQSAYGMKVDKKENLTQYFKEHYLPDASWEGWQEGMNLKAVRTKLIQKHGFNMKEMNVWENDKAEADLYGSVPLPNMNYRTRDALEVKSKLRSLLGSAGIKELDITHSFGGYNATLNIDLYENQKEKYEQKMKRKYGGI